MLGLKRDYKEVGKDHLKNLIKLLYFIDIFDGLEGSFMLGRTWPEAACCV
jgi:hypothetical protein